MPAHPAATESTCTSGARDGSTVTRHQLPMPRSHTSSWLVDACASRGRSLDGSNRLVMPDDAAQRTTSSSTMLRHATTT
jgi:hypothetical protein